MLISGSSLIISSIPYLYAIAEGSIAGYSAWSKIGYNGDVDAGTDLKVQVKGLTADCVCSCMLRGWLG